MCFAVEKRFENSLRKLGRPIGGVGKQRIKEESIFIHQLCVSALSYEEVTAFGNILRRFSNLSSRFDIVCVFRHCKTLLNHAISRLKRRQMPLIES